MRGKHVDSDNLYSIIQHYAIAVNKTRAGCLYIPDYVRLLQSVVSLDGQSAMSRRTFVSIPQHEYRQSQLLLPLQESYALVAYLDHEILVPLRNHAHRDHHVRGDRGRVAVDEAGQVVEQVPDDPLGHERRGARVGGVRERALLPRELLRDAVEGLDRDPDLRGHPRVHTAAGERVGEDGVCICALGRERAFEAEYCGWFVVREPVESRGDKMDGGQA